MGSLCLQQDAPVTYADLEQKVLPAVNDAFGPMCTAHLLNRYEGGLYFSVRAGKPCVSDGFNVRFNFANWASRHGTGAPAVATCDWTHTLGYRSDTTAKWTTKEKETLEAALVNVLQWRPLRSRGYKRALAFYTAPSNYDYKGQLPEYNRKYWNKRKWRPMLRAMHIKRPRPIQASKRFTTC